MTVLAGGDPRRTRRQLEGLRGLVGTHDRILVLAPHTARTSGLAQPRTTVVAATPERRAEALAEAARACDVVLVVEDHAVVADRRVIEGLEQAVATAGPTSVVVPATNGAAWPQCPPDVPDDDVARGDVRAYGRQLAQRPFAPPARPATVAGPALATTGAALAALDPAVLAAALATATVGALGAALLPAGAAPHLAGDAYVHATEGGPLLSACLIVKDEMEFLPACIASLRGLADEVVIYDTGSTDGTIEAARAMGAIVIEGHWDDDFARARNASLAACRGRWVVHIDADETIEDTDQVAAPMRDYLRRNTRFECVAVNLHNLEGSREAYVRNVQGSLVSRFMRRTRCHWVGEIHEQPMARPGYPTAQYVASDILRFLHAGYLPEVMAERGKHERNARIAQAAVASADFPDAGKRRFDLGRSLTLVRRHAEAMAHFEAAATLSDNPVFQRSALEFGAQTLLELGRFEEALEWAGRLADRAPEMGVAQLLAARAHMALGDVDAALDLVEGLTDYNDRYSNNPPDGVAVFKAMGLLRSGRPDEAAATSLEALQLNVLSPGAWPILAAAFDADGATTAGDVTRATTLVTSDRLTAVLAHVLHAAPRGGDRIAEDLWVRFGGATAVLAYASDLAPKLDLERAGVWAARLRAAGLAACCPLLAIAASPTRPAAERIRAALLAVASFDDDGGRDAVEAAAGELDDDDVTAVAAEVLALAPQLADSFIVGAATSPVRALALVAPLLDDEHPAEAVAVAGFVAALEGAEGADEAVAALDPVTVRRLAEAAEAQGRHDVVALTQVGARA